MVKNHLQLRGYRVLQQRFKTPYGEIDLLIESPKGGLVVLEVKNLGRVDWLERRISQRQLLRLQGLRTFIESKYEEEVSLWAAFVFRGRIFFNSLV